MRVDSWKVWIAAAAMVCMVIPTPTVYANDAASSASEQGSIFMSKPAPLSASQAAAYENAQAETIQDACALATGEDNGDGVSGLEVVGILALLGLGAAALAVAAAD
ncbi:MAG: hypothetical protein MI923_03115 [Phycisphaerales bacterium]|nr:hypothetical protein [Phycisphaerales bacterium]